MKLLLRKNLLALAALFSVILAGCSVLTVDVDVYKGPLANHEEVQLQQAAVMAAGAKPLLVQLRDSWEIESQRTRTLAEFREKNKAWYKPGFVRPKFGEARFTNDAAIRVNAILALYDDEQSLLRDLLESVEKSLESSVENYLHFQLSKQDVALWDAAAGGNLRTNAVFATNLFAYTTGVTNVDLPSGKAHLAMELKTGGTSYIFRPTLHEAEATNLTSILASVPDPLKPGVTSRMRDILPTLTPNYSTNHIFLWMTNRDLLEIHSLALFTNRTADVRALEDRWQEVAAAFLNGREHLSHAVVDSLRALFELSDPKSASEDIRQALLKEFASFVPSFIQPEKLVQAVYTEPSLKNSKTLKFLKETGIVDSSDLTWPTLKVSRSVANELFTRFIVENPADAALEFLEAHNRQLEGSEPLNRKKYPFGIGDTLNEQQEKKRVTEFATMAQRAIRRISDIAKRIESGAGLDGGRSNQGIEKLASEFINAAPENKETAKKALMEELTRFSEKVLFLANNDVLLRTPHWRGVGRSVGRWVKGSVMGFDTLINPPDPDSYSEVLQVIANSILVEVDELYQRESHTRYETNSVNGRVLQARAALKAAYNISSDLQITRWKDQLKGPKFSAEKLTNTVEAFDKALVALTNALTQVTNAQAPFAVASSNLTRITNQLALFSQFTNQPPLSSIKDVNPTTKATQRAAITNSFRSRGIAAAPSERLAYAELNDWIATQTLRDDATSKPGSEVFQSFVADFEDATLKAIKEFSDADSALKWAKDAAKAADDAVLKAKTAKETEEAARKKTYALDSLNEVATKDFVAGRPDPLFLWESLLQAARDKAEKNPTDETATKANSLVQFLEGAKPIAPRIPVSVDKLEESKRVLDQLIASLRYELSRAVLEEGKDAPSAANITAALNAVLEQRAGMIYIRPASSYLRTSFSSASLQQGTQVGWRNMLAEHGRRQLPFASVFEKTKKLRALQEIDKQFWQNVNQVRVAGAGTGNYAIAKDDLGNWYVKNYSTNPERIIKSAQNLAMFSLGPQLGAALPIQSGSTGQILAGATNGAAPQNGLLGDQLGKTLITYTNETLTNYLILASTASSNVLSPDVVAAFKSAALSESSSNAMMSVEVAARKSIVNLPEKPNPKLRPQDEILRALKGLNRYRSVLLTGAARLEDDADREKARKAIDDILKPVISGPLEERIDSVSRAKERVEVLSDITRK